MNSSISHLGVHIGPLRLGGVNLGLHDNNSQEPFGADITRNVS